MKPRTWANLFGLFPGTQGELATALGISRQSLWVTVSAAHDRVPLHTVRRLLVVLRRCGTIDGSRTPSLQEAVVAWRRARAALLRRA